MKLYHYSSEKFDTIDMSKTDGFWMTTIAPLPAKMLEEIGASGINYVAICELEESDSVLLNGDNFDVEEQLESSSCDYIENRYDGFEDYAVAKADKVKIIEWVKL